MIKSYRKFFCKTVTAFWRFSCVNRRKITYLDREFLYSWLYEECLSFDIVNMKDIWFSSSLTIWSININENESLYSRAWRQEGFFQKRAKILLLFTISFWVSPLMPCDITTSPWHFVSKSCRAYSEALIDVVSQVIDVLLIFARYK